MMGPGIGWMWFMPLLGVVFLALVVWAVVALVQGFTQPGAAGGPGQQDSALEILKRRYARGEITKQEYEERKKDLI